MKYLIPFLLLFLSFQLNAQEVVLKHRYYTNWYNTKYNISDSTKYTLSKTLVNGNVGRMNRFVKDPLLKSSPVSSDYTNSGYDRGHGMPAASCSGNARAMKECFYMTNMTPQKHSFNAGIWKRLEIYVRTIVNKPDVDSVRVCIYPLYDGKCETISKKKIVVPMALKKTLLIYPSMKTESYSIPNKKCNKPLRYFKCEKIRN